MTDPARGPERPKGRIERIRILIVVAEATLILAILGSWLFWENVRTDRSLGILFLYSFPSEFLVGLVPHEPVLLFYGQYYSAWTVAVVAGVGTVLAEWMNYSFLSFFSDVGAFEKARRTKVVDRIVRLFGRAPFLAVIVAGLTPIPFFPIRFLVVLERYSRVKYLVGVFLSRAPRFFLLAAVGGLFRLPSWSLLTMFLIMALAVYLPLLRRSRRPAY